MKVSECLKKAAKELFCQETKDIFNCIVEYYLKKGLTKKESRSKGGKYLMYIVEKNHELCSDKIHITPFILRLEKLQEKTYDL